MPEHLKARFGKDNPDEIFEAFYTILEDASNNGMSTIGLEKLNELLEEYRSIFRIRLGPDEPAKVRPLLIKPTTDAKPFRCTQRR